METDFETIELQVRDYVSPECSCKVEDMIGAVPHIVEASFDPVNNILKVKVHKGMASAKDACMHLSSSSPVKENHRLIGSSFTDREQVLSPSCFSRCLQPNKNLEMRMPFLAKCRGEGMIL